GLLAAYAVSWFTPVFGLATSADPDAPAGAVPAHVWPFMSTRPSKFSASIDTMPSGPGSCRKPTPEMLTFVNDAVQSTVSLWDVTASPTMAAAPRAMVSEPTVVHEAPSDETEPVSVDPVRTMRTQYGATTTGPGVWALAPPTAVRRWNDAPLPGVITIIAWRAASES